MHMMLGGRGMLSQNSSAASCVPTNLRYKYPTVFLALQEWELPAAAVFPRL